jgi:hypothetical protein
MGAWDARCRRPPGVLMAFPRRPMQAQCDWWPRPSQPAVVLYRHQIADPPRGVLVGIGGDPLRPKATQGNSLKANQGDPMESHRAFKKTHCGPDSIDRDGTSSASASMTTSLGHCFRVPLRLQVAVVEGSHGVPWRRRGHHSPLYRHQISDPNTGFCRVFAGGGTAASPLHC